MARFETNKKIADILKQSILEQKYGLGTSFSILVPIYPMQRCGQIITNYICNDYRDEKVSEETKEILEYIFPGDPDPFFEESITTLNRLCKK